MRPAIPVPSGPVAGPCKTQSRLILLSNGLEKHEATEDRLVVAVWEPHQLSRYYQNLSCSTQSQFLLAQFSADKGDIFIDTPTGVL